MQSEARSKGPRAGVVGAQERVQEEDGGALGLGRRGGVAPMGRRPLDGG